MQRARKGADVKASGRARRYARLTAFIAVVAAVALVLIPVAIESNGGDRLQAFVAASTHGPLCTVSCTSNTVWDLIYVSNANPIESANDGQFRARDTLHNAFVISSVDQTIFVDGDQYSTTTTWTPPPYPGPAAFPGYAARWTETVQCPATGPPCNEVRSPAVLPGEKTAVLFLGWGHGPGEPNGKYVFEYTVHGTLNGIPVDVTAQSQPISMTD
jgi:hypothetical protein